MSVHDFAITSVIEKFRTEGKVAHNNHSNHSNPWRVGRIPDIVVENPPELYEVEVMNKEPLPKQNGTRRILLIVTSLDWDEILVTSDGEFREASEIEVRLRANFNQEKQELDAQIKCKEQVLRNLEEKALRAETKLSQIRKEHQRLSSSLPSRRRSTKWDSYISDCLRREQSIEQSYSARGSGHS